MPSSDLRMRLSHTTLLAAVAAVLATGALLVACQGASSPTEPRAEATESASQLDLTTATAKGGQSKVDVCHIPPDDPENRHVITVGEKAVPAHLSHGDTLFGEEVCDAVDNDCDGLIDEDDVCGTAGIDLEKEVSVDGGTTWFDADSPTGPTATPGANNVFFRFALDNTGDVALDSVALTDTDFQSAIDSTCIYPSSLGVGNGYQCVIGPFVAEIGQHYNNATATASYTDGTVSDSDVSHYFSESNPGIDLEKEVSVDGGNTWFDADSPTGPTATPGANNVFFRFALDNTGDVALDSVTLTDTDFQSAIDSTCVYPSSLGVGNGYQCVIGPFVAEIGQHYNNATATASYTDGTVSDSDVSHYFGDLP